MNCSGFVHPCELHEFNLIVCYPQFVIICFHVQVDIPASALCVQSLVETSRGLSEHEWEVGWSLASHNNESQSSKDNFQTQVIPFLSS